MGNQKSKRKATHNISYSKSEGAIRNAIFSLIGSHLGRLKMRQVAKAAGVSCKTIYRHHSNINRAIIESENAILEEFSAELDVQSQKLLKIIDDHNTRLFYSTIVFMTQRQDVFNSICSGVNNRSVLYRMADELLLKLEITWLPKGTPTPAPDSERAKMLKTIMVELLCRWAISTHCNFRKSSRVIERLSRAVADAAANRLP